MPATRKLRTFAFALSILVFLGFSSAPCRAQAALLMEEPYGFFGAVNPTGHTAIYFERVCAESPTHLRRCQPGETGAVVSRYQGIANLDWVAIPLVPYLYSVEKPSDVPTRVDRDAVERLRDRYHETHLLGLGMNIPAGNMVHGGWTELIGVSYERRIYAFRFETTEEQDDTFIARMNHGENVSHFDLLFNNCSDFARRILNSYFPGTFRRSVFPDAAMTTPKQIAYKLVRYARKHPDVQLTVFEIPQVPGLRRLSRSNKSIDESLATTAYAVPIALANPYLAGGLFVDYLVRGRFHLIPKHPQMLGPSDLSALTLAGPAAQNPESASSQASGAAANGNVELLPPTPANFGLKESKASDE
jgi:hypothetical protein